MGSNISLLCEVLKKEKSHYEALLKLAKIKQEQIVSNEVEELLATIEREKEILQNIEEEENKRMGYLGGFKESGDSFGQICQRADPATTGKLRKLRDDLLLLLEELAEINEINNRLLQDALNLNQMMFEGIADSPDRVNYDPAGPKDSNSMLLDKRV